MSVFNAVLNYGQIELRKKMCFYMWVHLSRVTKRFFFN